VNEKLTVENFTIDNMPERVTKRDDLWNGLLDGKIRKANAKALKNFL